MTTSILTRRSALALGGAALAAPMLAGQARAAMLDKLVLQTPRSGPAFLLAHTRAIGAFDAVAPEVDLPLWMGFDQMRAGFVSGDVPVTIMPTQGAASLYNKGFGMKMLATVTEGHCGLLSREMENIQVSDLKGKKVVLSGINGFTGHMMRLGLNHAGIGLDELELIPAASHMEAAQVILSGRAEAALIAEPASTAALMKAKAEGISLHRGVQMREVLGQITGLRPVLPQACLAIRSEYAEAHPELSAALVEALKTGAASVNANPAQAAADAAALLEGKAKVLEQAIPYASISVMTASEARPEIEALYTALMAADPKIIGGKMPDDGLFAL